MSFKRKEKTQPKRRTQFIGICSPKGATLYEYIQIESKDFDEFMRRVELFKERWKRNDVELFNNGSPIRTRDYSFDHIFGETVFDNVLEDKKNPIEPLEIYDTSEIDIVDSLVEYINIPHISCRDFE